MGSMDSLKIRREARGLTQRALAQLAGLSYKTLQLIEARDHDPKLSTLQRIASALGYPDNACVSPIEHVFAQPVDSIHVLSVRILSDASSWKIHLFNFVDAYRANCDPSLILEAPVLETSHRFRALLAGTVETLCDEAGQMIPDWCRAIQSLSEPWFVADVENLKAIALAESPINFRKRNVFVLENFLERT
jgi:transcriptional regulator with XRE-family HTH domain